MRKLIFVLALMLLPYGIPGAEALTLTIDTINIITPALIEYGHVAVDDGGAGDLDGSLDGYITFMDSVGGYDTSLTFATSSTPGGFALLELESTNTRNAGYAGSITIKLADTYNTPPGVGQVKVEAGASGILTAATGSKITAQSYLTSGVNTAAVYSTGTNESGLGGFTFAGSTITSFALASDFTLWTEILVNFAAQPSCSTGCENSVSFSLANVDIKPVPEPASMFLLGSGLLGLATAARNRKRSAR